MALAESIMGAARDHRSHEQVTPLNSVTRESEAKPTKGEIPAWVLKEIEVRTRTDSEFLDAGVYFQNGMFRKRGDMT